MLFPRFDVAVVVVVVVATAVAALGRVVALSGCASAMTMPLTMMVIYVLLLVQTCQRRETVKDGFLKYDRKNDEMYRAREEAKLKSRSQLISCWAGRYLVTWRATPLKDVNVELDKERS
jgi:hypothetical protein